MDQEGYPRRETPATPGHRVPERKGPPEPRASPSSQYRAGDLAWSLVGDISVHRRGPAGPGETLRARRGPPASEAHPGVRRSGLAIVTLICFLVGAILAFIGAVQLAMFGAQIYVANLVGMAMTLEMGAMMTAIIMAGRTGAAFAAQLGTMTVNEEIDALTTLGLSPMEFLVVPRMLALVTMMPLLTLYGDLLGILGGGLIGVTVLGISPVEYFNQTRAALTLSACAQGLIKSAVYGMLVALAGCLRGCGRIPPRRTATPRRWDHLFCIILASPVTVSSLGWYVEGRHRPYTSSSHIPSEPDLAMGVLSSSITSPHHSARDIFISGRQLLRQEHPRLHLSA